MIFTLGWLQENSQDQQNRGRANTHSQALAMTWGESEINVSLPEPESIFKHLSIVSVWEVTPSLPPFCDTDKTKARGSTGCYFVHWYRMIVQKRRLINLPLMYEFEISREDNSGNVRVGERSGGKSLLWRSTGSVASCHLKDFQCHCSIFNWYLQHEKAGKILKQ